MIALLLAEKIIYNILKIQDINLTKTMKEMNLGSTLINLIENLSAYFN